MTVLLSDLITECQDQLGEVPGSDGWRNRPSYLTHLQRTFDEMARRTRCYYTTFRAPVTAGVAQVAGPRCPFPIFDIEEARLTDADGLVCYLSLSLPEWARWYGNGWQYQGGYGLYDGYSGVGYGYDLNTNGFDWRDAYPVPRPWALITAGANDVKLFPAPNYTDPAGTASLAVTGYGVPLPPPDASGNPKDMWAEIDPFPYDPRLTATAIEGVKWRRVMQYQEKFSPQRLVTQERVWKEELAMLTSEARSFTPSARVIGAYA